MLKMRNLLVEAPEDDIKKAADSGLAQSVSLLQKLATDPDTSDLLNKGKEDGDLKDESIKMSTSNVSCTKMFPTQAEIGFGNSLDDMVVNKYKVVDTCFKSPVTILGPVLCAKVGGKIMILDGHHRWSSCFMINRNAKMVCDILEMPSGKDAEDALKIMQIAIAAKAKAVKTKNFEGQDLMATSTEEVKQYIIDKMQPEVVELFSKYTNGALADKESIAEEVGEAHKDIVSMKGEFPRNIMPQADHTGGKGTQDIVNKALAAGEINFDEPFTVSDGYKATGKQLKEHFQRIAGIK
tara:strand:- start:540 stop:1424 length:885 start_codon:yes stop_codon:yes gene_type:complete